MTFGTSSSTWHGRAAHCKTEGEGVHICVRTTAVPS